MLELPGRLCPQFLSLCPDDETHQLDPMRKKLEAWFSHLSLCLPLTFSEIILEQFSQQRIPLTDLYPVFLFFFFLSAVSESNKMGNVPSEYLGNHPHLSYCLFFNRNPKYFCPGAFLSIQLLTRYAQKPTCLHFAGKFLG